MTSIDPFWMYDKVYPEDDNDPNELIKAADTADELSGQSKPERTINTLDEGEAFNSIRAFQQSRNLKPDGVVNPKGATAQRMTAERHAREERANPPAFATLLGRGARAPLWGSVGRGGQNLTRDVEVTKSALALTGQKISVPPPSPDSSKDAVGGRAIEDSLTRLQRQHGLTPDGLMTPFGETQNMLDMLLAPVIEALAGRDPKNPKPYLPRDPKIAAKTLKFRPTTTRTSFQDDDSLPVQVEHVAAVDLMGAIAEDVDFELARRAHDATFAAETGNDRLTGSAGDDMLDDNSLDDVRQSPATPEEAPAAEPELIMSDAARDQIEEAEQKVKSRARAWRNTSSGREAQQALARRVTNAREDLVAAWIEAGLSAEAAAAMANEWMAEIAPDTLGQWAMQVMEFVPGIGEGMSLVEAARLRKQIEEAQAGGDDDRVDSLKRDLALALIGAVPFLGKGAKLAKVVDRVTDKAGFTRRQKARHRLDRARGRSADSIEPFTAQQALGDEVWNSLSEGTRRSLRAIVNNRKGEADEKLVKNWLDKAGLHRPLKKDETRRRRYVAYTKGQEKITRHLDEVTTQHFEKTFGGLWLKKVEGGKGWEVKTDGAKLSANQRKFEEALDSEAAFKPSPAKGSSIDLPEIDRQIENLRVPLGEVDEDEFRRLVRKSLVSKKHDSELIDQMDEGIKVFFQHHRAARHRGDDDFANRMTVASVLLAVSASLPGSEGDQNDENFRTSSVQSSPRVL